MKGRNRIVRVFCLIFPCVLFAGLISGCAEAPRENTIYITSAYSSPISLLFPDCEVVTEHVRARLDSLHRGGVIEAYDVQAESSSVEYWYPLTLETVVIAVDRDKTDMAIASWNDLSTSAGAKVVP